MTPQLLLKHFDRINEAPDAIPRLRRFILDLAVRGKLVEQDPRDEPAFKLLKRIQAEKERLVSSGEIKKEKPLPAIEVEETPFPSPAKWEWVRLKNITSYIQRGKSPKYASAEGLPVISQKCVQWDGLDFASAKLITSESIGKYEPIRFLRSGDLLWNSTGTGTIGRIIKVSEPPSKLVCDSHVTVVRCLNVDAEYVRSWLRSDHVYGMIEDRAAGSTNQVELTSQMAMNQVVPLPPLAEQHRIVAKVNELMALCDRLEAAQTERENRRDRLVTSSLHHLNNGADTFREHARFYFNHLPRLTTRPAHIKQLRQTILNLAVRGKLVEQDPTDEPASELLKRIQAERTRLVNVGARRRQTAFSQVEKTKFPFEIPSTWCWVHLNDVLTKLTDGTHHSPPNLVKGPFKYITAKNIKPEGVSLDKVTYVTAKVHNEIYTRCNPEKGDILYIKDGATTGIVTINDLDEPFSMLSSVALLKLSTHIYNRLIVEFLRSPFFYNQMRGFMKGAAITRVTLKRMAPALLPLPPLAEQHRIVAKVDELMALCDQLETQLTTTQTESQKLMEAILHSALANPKGKD